MCPAAKSSQIFARAGQQPQHLRNTASSGRSRAAGHRERGAMMESPGTSPTAGAFGRRLRCVRHWVRKRSPASALKRTPLSSPRHPISSSYLFVSCQNRCQSWKHSLCKEDGAGKTITLCLLFDAALLKLLWQRPETGAQACSTFPLSQSLPLHFPAGVKGGKRHLHSAAVTITKILLLSARANTNAGKG